METYVLRIFRRGQTGPDELVGILERPDAGRETSFRTFEELREVLVADESPKTGKRKERQGETFTR